MIIFGYVIFYSIIALAAFAGVAWVIIAPWVIHLSRWHMFWILLLLPFDILFFYVAIVCWRDMFEGTTTLEGTVTKKIYSPAPYDTDARHIIRVGGQQFKVWKADYDNVSEGDNVTVTYWRRTEVVDSVMRHPQLGEWFSWAKSG